MRFERVNYSYLHSDLTSYKDNPQIVKKYLKTKKISVIIKLLQFPAVLFEVYARVTFNAQSCNL